MFCCSPYIYLSHLKFRPQLNCVIQNYILFWVPLDLLPPLQELVIHPPATGVRERRSQVRRAWFRSWLGGRADFKKKKKRMTGVRNKIGVFQAPLDITWVSCGMLSVMSPFSPSWVEISGSPDHQKEEENLLPKWKEVSVVLCYKPRNQEPVVLFHA